MTFKDAHAMWIDGGVAAPETTGGMGYLQHTQTPHTKTDQSECPACLELRAFADSDASATRVPVETPSIYETLAQIAASLRDLADSQRKVLAALGASSDSRSSIEVKTSTRGVDVACKSYAQSDISGLVTPAVDAYFATLADVQQRLNGVQG